MLVNLHNFGENNITNNHNNNSNQTYNNVLLETIIIYGLFIHKLGNIILLIKVMQYSISTFFLTTTFCMIIVRGFLEEKCDSLIM